MNKKGLGKLVISGVIFLILCSVAFYFYYTYDKEQESFSVGSVFIKAIIKEDGSYQDTVIITSYENSNFSVSSRGLEGLLSFSPDKFYLEKGERREIHLNFSSGSEKGVYTGLLEISSDSNTKDIPLVLEVESKNVFFDSNLELFPKEKFYKDERINAEINIFDLTRIGTSKLDLVYFIKDFQGKKIISEKESIVVDDNVVITKFFIPPEDIPEGEYLFGVSLDYKGSVGTSSTFFTISDKEEKEISNETLIFVILIGAFLILFLFFIFYIISSRDKMFQVLQSQYAGEKKKQKKKIESKEESINRDLTTQKEKRLSKRFFSKIKKEARKELNEKYKERIGKLKEIKKNSERAIEEREDLLGQLEGLKRKSSNYKEKIRKLKELRKADKGEGKEREDLLGQLEGLKRKSSNYREKIKKLKELKKSKKREKKTRQEMLKQLGDLKKKSDNYKEKIRKLKELKKSKKREKGEIEKQKKKEIDEKIGELREGESDYRERIKKLKKLKKGKESEEMRKQLEQWEKKGYDTSYADLKISDIDDIRKKINEWKEKGYDTKILDKGLKRKF